MDTNFVTWTANTDYQQRVKSIERIRRYDRMVIVRQPGWSSRLAAHVMRLVVNMQEYLAPAADRSS